jgi:hypothetical protein
MALTTRKVFTLLLLTVRDGYADQHVYE